MYYTSRLNIGLKYEAIQLTLDNEISPLLPPNQFIHIDERTMINSSDYKEAKWLYQRQRDFHCNKYNRRKFVRGALYTELYANCYQIIKPSINTNIEIFVSINGGEEKITVIICYDIDPCSSILNNMNNLGTAMNEILDNTSRRNNNDEEKIHVVGEGYKANRKEGK